MEVVKPSSASSKKGTLAIRSPHVCMHTWSSRNIHLWILLDPPSTLRDARSLPCPAPAWLLHFCNLHDLRRIHDAAAVQRAPRCAGCWAAPP